MLRFLVTASAALIFAANAPTATAQTIRVLITTQDAEDDSLHRHSRVQKDAAETFKSVLNAPASAELYQRYGIQGFDVYDERAIFQDRVPPSNSGRTEDELIALSRSITNPRLDLLVIYTIFADAVPDSYVQGLSLLRVAMRYAVLDVRSGRHLGGDNLDNGIQGVPMTGCAAAVGKKDADGNPPKVYPRCVYDFVAEQVERLVRDAGQTIAIQIAALVAGQGSGGQEGSKDGMGGVLDQRSSDLSACTRTPTEYTVRFRNLTKQQILTLIERMSKWRCGLDIGLADSSPSEPSYTYKVRANEAMLKLNIEATLDAIGVTANVDPRGRNELVVKATPIRTN